MLQKAASYVDRILRGANACQVLSANGAAAKTGHGFRTPLLGRAHSVGRFQKSAPLFCQDGCVTARLFVRGRSLAGGSVLRLPNKPCGATAPRALLCPGASRFQPLDQRCVAPRRAAGGTTSELYPAPVGCSVRLPSCSVKQIEDRVSCFVELIVAFVCRRKRNYGICLAHVLHPKAPNLVVIDRKAT